MNPHLLIRRARGMLFYSRFLMELTAWERALKALDETVEITLIMMSVISSPNIGKKNEIKDGLKWNHTVRLQVLAYYNMSICHEQLEDYQKMVECAKDSFWLATNFLNEEEELTHKLKKYKTDFCEGKYSGILKEISEIERVIFSIFDKKFQQDFLYSSEEEEQESDEEKLDFVREIHEKLDQNIKYDDLFLKSQPKLTQERNEEWKASLTKLQGSHNFQNRETPSKKEKHSTKSMLAEREDIDDFGAGIKGSGKLSSLRSTMAGDHSASNRPGSSQRQSLFTDRRTASFGDIYKEGYMPIGLTTPNYFKNISQIIHESQNEKANLRKSNSNFLKTKYAGQSKKHSIGGGSSTAQRKERIEELIDMNDKGKRENRLPGDIDKYFKHQIAESILKKYESKNLEEVKGDVLFQFKQEEFDKKEFKAGKKRLYLRERENFSSDLAMNEFKRAQIKSEIQWNLTKMNIEEGNKALQHDIHHFVTVDYDEENKGNKKRTWLDVILAHPEVFKVKNVLALKQKKRQVELTTNQSTERNQSSQNEKKQLEASLRSVDIKTKPKTHVKDKIQLAMEELERNIEFADKNFTKMTKGRMTARSGSEPSLSQKFNSLSKSTKHFAIKSKRFDRLELTQLIDLSKRMQKNSKTNVYD